MVFESEVDTELIVKSHSCAFLFARKKIQNQRMSLLYRAKPLKKSSRMLEMDFSG